MKLGDVTRTALACVRIFNGALGLVAADRMAKSLGDELGDDKRFVYPARMFGIRTLVLGVDLLTLKSGDANARRVLRQAVLIHATDTAAAVYAGKRGELLYQGGEADHDHLRRQHRAGRRIAARR